MGKLLIIKTGENSKDICEKYGDFEDQIIKILSFKESDVTLWNVYKNEEKPDITDVYAIIITGSYSMVTDRESWSEMLSHWIQEIESLSIPILGICYGHQVLADSFGGTVGYHQKGKEFGTVRIELTEDGRKDPLVSVLPQEFIGNVAHSQTVLALPEKARVLAMNNFEPHHAIAFKDHIWGVQFHPEFDADYTLACIDECKDDLIKDNYDVESIKKSVQEADYGKALLKRFIELVKR